MPFLNQVDEPRSLVARDGLGFEIKAHESYATRTVRDVRITGPCRFQDSFSHCAFVL